MVTDVCQLHTLLWIRLQQLRDQIFSNTRETTWPLDSLVQDIVKELFLILTHEGWITCQQFKEEHAEIPDVKRLVMAALTDHLWSEVLRSTAICHAFTILVEEV